MTDISTEARWAYQHGVDRIDYAARYVVQTHIDVHLEIRAARAQDPAAFPGYVLPLTTEVLSLRIVGDLLDAGWTPPEVTT